MIGCTGTMYVVQWCDVMVRVWCDGTVQWCDGTVQWCAGMVQWCDGAVQCTSVPQCTHCTAPKRLLPKRFFLPKLAFLLTLKTFFCKKWCSGTGAVVQWTGTPGTVVYSQWICTIAPHCTAPSHRCTAPLHPYTAPSHRMIAPSVPSHLHLRKVCFVLSGG